MLRISRQPFYQLFFCAVDPLPQPISAVNCLDLTISILFDMFSMSGISSNILYDLIFYVINDKSALCFKLYSHILLCFYLFHGVS